MLELQTSVHRLDLGPQAHVACVKGFSSLVHRVRSDPYC